jgi:hypothetical protein
MKKYLAVLLVAVMVAFSAPAFAVTNPFMDVPLGHWAYDAVAQLAARGIISGFPDGMYRGGQPTTRFEMASVIARTLAVIDMTKASRQDVEMLMRLVVEFKDELDALGVRVDQLGGRVDALHNRLGGWRLGGTLRYDANFWRNDDNDGYFHNTMARLHIERFFGANEDMRVFIRLRQEHGGGAQLQRFFVEFPFFFDNTRMTVGRFDMSWETAYVFNVGGISAFQNAQFLTGEQLDGIGLTSNFGMGRFDMFVSRRLPAGGGRNLVGGNANAVTDAEPIEAGVRFALQPTERIGLDLAVITMVHDDNTTTAINHIGHDDNVTTFFVGGRFDFTDGVGFRGIYYHQRRSGASNPNAFRLALDVSQDFLGFTSLWLGYDRVDQGFATRTPFYAHQMLSTYIPGDERWMGGAERFFAPNDTQTWRLGATQQWNDAWRTWLYFGQSTFSMVGPNLRVRQWAAGIEYRLNPNVAFALNYGQSNWNSDATWGTLVLENNRLIRFRTQITF